MNKELIELKTKLDLMPRAKLGFFPTPLYRLDRLSDELNINLYIKRDDFTGRNLFGGNKTRKLEFLIGKALEDGCEYVFTYGATQSNHAMQTIWSASSNGLKPIVYLTDYIDTDEDNPQANLLLDKVYDAEIHIIRPKKDEVFGAAENRAFNLGAQHAKELESEGHKCMNIPMGGANNIGSLGYISAMAEVYKQSLESDIEFDHIYHATGSGGTMAGLVAGKKVLQMKTTIKSICVSDKTDSYDAYSASLANDSLALLGYDQMVSEDDFDIDTAFYAPGYEKPNEKSTEAIKLLAKTEGILTDPVYTGKALSGLIEHARSGKLKSDSNVVFLHTGGATALFAEKEILGNIF